MDHLREQLLELEERWVQWDQIGMDHGASCVLCYAAVLALLNMEIHQVESVLAEILERGDG